MKKSHWIPIVILILLIGLTIKLVSFSQTTQEAIGVAEETVEEEVNIGEENATFIDTGMESVDGVSISSLQLSTELAMTDCGGVDTSVYTIHPSPHKRADGSVEYITSYQYQVVETCGPECTSTAEIYSHSTDEFYDDDPLGVNRAWNPGEWEWKMYGDDEDPVLSAKLSEAATIEDEFIVKWTLISQGKEVDYSQSTIKPLQCSDGALYISDPFLYETEKLNALPSDAPRFFQVKVYYKDVRLDATTLSF